MALSNSSKFVYGFEVTTNNCNLDFQAVSGTTITAVLNIGSYTLTDYLTEVIRALTAADPTRTYTVSVNRNIAGGLENRITIATSGTFLSLMFGTGAHKGSSPALLMGFNAIDYTGALTYNGVTSAGSSVVSVYPGYTFVDATQQKEVFGSVNVSASGDKEAIVWQLQTFPEIEFQHEPLAKVNTTWLDFFEWAIQQQPFEFVPDYTIPTAFYPVTLESTDESGKGLAFKMKEELPNLPGLYRTGRLKMRLIVTPSEFLP